MCGCSKEVQTQVLEIRKRNEKWSSVCTFAYHMKMTCTSSTYLSLIIIILSRIPIPAAIDIAFNRNYDKKVCQNEPTCNLTIHPNLNPERLTLHKRDCMCDFECSEYGDCCKDSQYFNVPKINAEKKTYQCPVESGYYMVVSCSPTCTDESVVEKCNKALQPPDDYNSALVTPVTNLAKRLTYANAYCAVCNHEKDFELWQRQLACADAPEEYLTYKSNRRTDTSNAEESSSDDQLKMNLHISPGYVFGKGHYSHSGYNKEISIPTFGLGSNTLNKTFDSVTGAVFGVKVSRNKRQQPDKKRTISLEFRKYFDKLDNIKQFIKYSPAYQELIAEYDNEILLCKMSYKLPATLKSYVRPCVPNLISECTTRKDDNVCTAYTQIVYEKATKKPYRNKECASCNGVESSALTGCPQEVRTGGGTVFKDSEKAYSSDAACKESSNIAKKFCPSSNNR